jgi:antitoxin (DNA-binding transcriptional repressor) of toxin-antitoxin stability system
VKPGKINIHHAKTHLSRLIEDVANGNEVLIAKDDFDRAEGRF